jgi:ABC-type transport system involved in multi-copper enzyme maturation permease subunit
MEKTNEIKFERNSFGRRLKSMLSVDFRRMFTTRFFYIMAAVAAAIPILVLVMTTTVGGTASADSITGVEETVEMEPITNTWQAIEAISGEGSGMSSDIMSMCNINLLFFMAAVFVCIFVTDDFKSGYAKNLFTVRSKKTDYVISKSLVGFVGGAIMILAYFVGTVLGGAIAGLSFDAGAAGVSGIVMCLLSKMLLMAVFVPIYLLMSVVGKQKVWVSMVFSFAIGMLFFMMIPSLTPLDSTIMNVMICLIGGALFSAGLGAISNKILCRTSLV